jgi:hypothetical protein
VGTHHVKVKRRRKARASRPRARKCLGKECGRKYQPRVWNQRYCQDPECRREILRWQAAKRQAERRKDAKVRAQHKEEERVRRQEAKAAPQAVPKPEVAPERGHAAKPFPPLFYAIGRAATNRL